MKILFTGSSSFTGSWFIQALAQQGHDVTSLFQKTKESYQGVRKQRLENVCQWSHPFFECSFGSDSFLDLIHHHSWDIYCHHAADVTDYKSPDFDPIKAITNNTYNLKKVLNSLVKKGCHQIVLTGTVFEQGEGIGSDALRPFSPYGLSKGVTSEIFKFYCQTVGIKLGKFVIPNPFGPYEEARFTSFLMEAWSKNLTPFVECPDYVRDNIPISLLAKAYAHFVEKLPNHNGFLQLNPSGYPESQGAFTHRFAREMSARLALPCSVEIKTQKHFLEPKVRINTDPLDWESLGWNESQAWDELASYYDKIYGLSL